MEIRVLSVAVVAVALVACSEPATTPAATGPSAPGSEPAASIGLDESPSSGRPDSWSGVRVLDGRAEVLVDGGPVLAEMAAAGAEAPSGYSDVDHGEPVLWSTCCEPVVGSTRAQEGFRDYGARVDRAGDLMVRVGGDGTVFTTVDGRIETAAFAGVVDATIAGGQVVAIRDLSQAPSPDGDAEAAGGPALVVVSGQDIREVAPLEAAACAITRYGDEGVAVLHSDGPQDGLWCAGSRLSVIDQRTWEVLDELRFEDPVIHLSSDDSGEWLLLTRASGAVGWRHVDGSTGRLADGDFVLADW